jgi:hypothetical protein
MAPEQQAREACDWVESLPGSVVVRDVVADVHGQANQTGSAARQKY